MNKPRILVLTAAGRTGMPVALQLLSEGFPVTAFVHKADQRSERLKAKGADIVVGSLTDITDMRTAMAGVQRAYVCFPNAAGYLKGAAIFTAVAAEHHLETVVAMSQWLSNPNHPAIQTREIWLADRLFALLPGTAVTFINPGFFADDEMQVLPFAAQFGLLPLPSPVMRMLTGVVYGVMSRSLRVSNRRFKEASGWQPEVPNARVGWACLAKEGKAAEPIKKGA
ncbi:MAG TPA: NAD(P)H-binding protein [Ktedonobacteraceae bacterium]|nr:NAD(P)H-binding protein [Ktedonobacteraceae bacterium]